MVAEPMELTDDLWNKLSPHLPEPQPRRADRRGRPWRPNRPVLAGILWVLTSGARWKDLPRRPDFAPYQTCHRRFQAWCRDGTWEHLLAILTEQLRDAGRLDLAEAFIDGTFAPAKKGAPKSVVRRKAKARS
jgi:transposase